MAGRQLRLVLFRQLRGIDLADHVAQAIAFPGDIGRIALEAGQLRAKAGELLPGGGVAGQLHLAMRIEQAPLERLVQKRLMVVRPVDIHQQATKRPQRLHRRGRIVHPDTSAARGGNGAAHEQDTLFARRQALFVQKRVHRLSNA